MKTKKIGKDYVKCCICGDEIERYSSHDPYPVREETWMHDDVRCCKKCNDFIVLPIRVALGRDGGGYHEQLKKMNLFGLVKFMHDHKVAPMPQKVIQVTINMTKEKG